MRTRFVSLAARVMQRGDEGASAVEYALMLFCVAAVVVAGATVLGVSTNTWLGLPLAGF